MLITDDRTNDSSQEARPFLKNSSDLKNRITNQVLTIGSARTYHLRGSKSSIRVRITCQAPRTQRVRCLIEVLKRVGFSS